MYADELADVYDLLYSGKDYAGEAATLAQLIRDRLPQATSLLDVACGSGMHLAQLRDEFDHVEGLELSPHMASRARARVPGVPVALGDMRTFSLARRFDAVVCLFSSIGYLGDVEGLHTAIARMAAHLAADGVLMVEAFHTPEEFIDGHHSAGVAREPGRTVTRLSVSTNLGTTGVMDMHMLVADASGVRYFSDRHELALFTDADYQSAFTAAGLEASRIEGILTGRGLWIAQAPAEQRPS